MMSLAQFEATYANTYVDVDDAAGNQCWDIAQLYYTLCVNPAGTLWTVPGAWNPGYASGTWEGFAVNGLSADFVQISPDQPTQYGDLVICAYGSATYPVSHVFVALADAGPLIYGLSQNSSPARPDLPGYSHKSTGPVVRQYLPKDRIAGYLRPRTRITGQSSNITPIISKEDTLSAAEVNTILSAIASTEKGLRQNIKDHFLGGTNSSDGWRPGATKLLIENQRRINASNAKLAALEETVKQLAKGQGVAIDYTKINAQIKAALADGIEITGTIAAKDGNK